ncbi:hypothetical protein Sps_03711 [Shewanella psychrophila]|uniref:Curlin associated repeat-containing protein n=1 Tax=Shewanella psychrophila TaxID=225848 RepID=A0A1S6HTI8_9GAMM|nr:hypothetical protein [Shewanella psychrophila]AQS38829.1 hypothetical protein Sps_03711 [Shewanella psychrophila]
MMIAYKKPLLIVLCISSSLSFSINAKQIVASGSQLEVSALSTENKFDEAIVTITGPNGFEKQIRVDANNSELDIEQLGIVKDGNYSYQVEYSQWGEVEIVNDRKTGRQGATRNLGKVETKSGYFNVRDSEFVQEADYEGEQGQETKADQMLEQIVDKNNFEIVDEQLAK